MLSKYSITELHPQPMCLSFCFCDSGNIFVDVWVELGVFAFICMCPVFEVSLAWCLLGYERGSVCVCAWLCVSWGHLVLYLCVLLEMPFPNDDQRNTRESLSKAKRKALLLQKGAATDHSLIGRTH
jgi:hypothetical protein